MSDYWNHNTHYHVQLLGLLPESGGNALEVGCGDGIFTALLAPRFDSVLAVDPDADQVAATRARCAALPNVTVHQAGLLNADLPSSHFDAVTALAAWHHMPFADAAATARRVLRPGGRLVILGVWQGGGASGVGLTLASTVLHQALRLRRGADAMTAPATFNRTNWTEVRAEAAKHLPEGRLRRHLLWRYTLVWDKPEDAVASRNAK